MLRAASGEAVDLSMFDANVVASLLKQYLRELPDSLLTSRLQDRFEQVTSTLIIYVVSSCLLGVFECIYMYLCVCLCVYV